MALQAISQVNITLQGSGVTRAGFGVVMFIGAHRWFSERVRSYTELPAPADGIPTSSQEYAALTAAFQQTPSPSLVKIGRREADSVLAPTGVANGSVYTVDVSVNDGDTVAVSFVAGVSDTEEDVVDAIKLAIDSDVNVAAHVTTTKNGTGAATTLTISATLAADFFVLSNETANLTISYTTTETAADVIQNISAVDPDFYFVTAHDHSEAFVLAMAAVVEALDKIYFSSNQDASGLAAPAIPATSTVGKVFESNYLRSVTMWNHEADEKFTEVSFASYNAPFDPGKVTWSALTPNGVQASRHPTTGLILSSTEQQNLAAKNCNFLQLEGGKTITRQGLVAGGENIDVIRFRDFLTARINEGMQNLLTNQQGQKLPMNDDGIASVTATVETILARYVSTEAVPNGLDSFKVTFPKAKDISAEDRAAGILNGTFVGFLTGAVKVIKIDGKLTFNTQA